MKTIVTTAAIMLFLAQPTFAGTQGELCVYTTMLVGRIAELRDNGLSYMSVRTLMKIIARDNGGTPEDIRKILSFVDYVYQSPEKSTFELSRDFARECFSSIGDN